MKNKFKITALLLLAILIVSTGLGCKSCSKDEANENIPPVTLNFWGLWDDESVYGPIIDAYKTTHPNVNINYQKFTYDEYEDQLINALAAGRGPDIWMVHHTWLPKHSDKIACAPPELISGQEFQSTFVDVVGYDFMIEDYACGVALSVDTLALYYNKDLFNTAHLTEAPADWNTFKENVEKLTKLDDWGNIVQSGAAIGTSDNVNRAVDILYLLMLQNGTQMIDPETNRAAFNQYQNIEGQGSYNPGLVALQFYTDFASPRKKVYSWNPTLPNSIESFTSEKTAMMFNYFYQQAELEAKAPRLNYAVAPMPQIKGAQKEINYPNYWGYVVSSASENKADAWSFLAFMANKDSSKLYLDQTKRPAARRDLIQEQLQDPNLKIFAAQAITARSWMQIDEVATEEIFNKTIDDVVLERKTAEEALKNAATQVDTIMAGYKGPNLE